MTPSLAFLADLTIALTLAMGFGAVAARLHLNPILGYLAAGIAIGPATPGYVARSDALDTMATLGLIFLLFSIGLGFSFAEIVELGPVQLAGNLVVMALVAGVAAECATLAHLAHPLTLGLITAVSSTAVGAALLRGWNVEGEVAGRFAVAQLVVQDLVAVALLVLTSVPPSQLGAAAVGIAAAKTIGFVAIALVLGATVLHHFVRRALARAHADSLVGLFSALALGAAWLAYLAGLGFEFGAFVAGAVISEAAGSRMVATVVAPFRALFVALFFVSIGMLLDTHFFAAHWIAIVATGVVFAAIRAFAWGVLARIGGLALGGAALAGLAMTSLGEFNIVLADEARNAHRIASDEAQLLLGVSLVTIVVSVVLGPYFGRLRDRGAGAARPALPQGERGGTATVAIVGFGRVGKTVASVLRHAGIAVSALERDRGVAERARSQGFDVLVGEATDPNALEHLIGPKTALVLVAVPESADSRSVVERIAASTGARVIARAASIADVVPLRERGAALALIPEAEGALVFAASVLRALGRAHDTIERELDAERARSPAVADPRGNATGIETPT